MRTYAPMQLAEHACGLRFMHATQLQSRRTLKQARPRGVRATFVAMLHGII